MSVFPDPFTPANPNQTGPGQTPVPFDSRGGQQAPTPTTTASDNPFAELLNHVQGFNSAIANSAATRAGQPPQPQPSSFFAPGTATSNATPEIPGNPNEPPSGPTTPPPPTTPITHPGPPVPIPGMPDVPVRQHPSAPPSGPPTGPANPHPEWWSDWAWQNANAWGAQGSGYEYLAQNPGILDQYVHFVQGAQDLAHNQGIDPNTITIDVVDWLASAGYSSPAAGRRGYDTVNQFEDGTPTPWGNGQAAPPPGTPPPGTPGGPRPGGPPTTTPPPAPIDPNRPPTQPPTTAPPPTDPNAPPPPTTPPVVSPTDPSPPTAPPGTPPTTPPGTPPAAMPPDQIQSLIDEFNRNFKVNQPDVESMLDPMFARQRMDLQQQLEAQAALTPGRLQSGGFGQNEGNALANLSGQQGATMAQTLQAQAANQMQQNTALMSLATNAGMQKYMADLSADTQKYQVNTNADLQRWLDSQDNALKKYGVDTNDVLQRYQAELQLKGVQYAADKSVDAAALNKAASTAAAHAAQTEVLNQQKLNYDLGLANLSVDREKNIGQFILGLLGMGNLDINAINGILNGLPPGTTVVHP